MPLYTYLNKKTGVTTQLMVPIDQRDRVRGHKRVPEFATGRLGLAENPHTQDYGVRQGLKDMEEKYGHAEMQRQLGADMSLAKVKRTWRN